MFRRTQVLRVFDLLVFAVMLILCGRMGAQTSVDGAVAGTVVDSSGAALPAATVVVHSTATNANTTVSADGTGYFRASRLVPGDYSVKVTATGFADYTAQHVVVEVGKLTNISPVMGAAGSPATVIVSSDAPIMNTESSDVTSEFNPTALNTLPINGRHWTSFALLSPGVSLGNSSYGIVSFRGQSPLQNNFLVDGVDDNDAFQAVERGYSRVGYSTAPDSILEFQVLTSNYSAQYGRAEGGGVNAVTRSGGNEFHGDAFEYYRDNDFGATNPFNILQTIPTTVHVKPKDKRHQYGGSLGGPGIKDKLFFFYAFDQQRRNFPVVAVPTPQFLAYSNASYNNCKNSAGGAAVDAVTCALDRGVSQTQINAAESYIAGLSGIAPRFGDQIVNFGKLDYHLNDRQNFSLLYNRMRWDSLNGIQTNPIARSGVTTLGNDFDKVDSVIGKATSLLTPKMSNEFRVGYARDFDVENGDKPMANEPTTTTGGLPPGVIISTNSGFSLGSPTYTPRAAYPDERVIEIADNVTTTLGNHTLNAGLNYHWVQDNITDIDYLHGQFTYAQVADFFTDFARANGASVGCDAARDSGVGTLPCYTTLRQAFGRPQFVFHTTEYGAYIQDDWKIAKRLVLNLGLRYDDESLPNPKIPNPNASLAQTNYMPSDKNNIAPRVGLAWDAFGTGKTLVHAGFGLYYGRIQNGSIFRALATTAAPSGQFSVQTSSSAANAPVYPFILSTGTPPAVSNIQAFAPNFQNPVADEADFSVQQAIGWNTVLGVAYLGSFGKNLPDFIDTNIAPATTTRTYTFSGGPFAGRSWTVPLYTARVNPAVTAYTQIFSNVTSSYNALALTAEHRLKQGVQFNVSYTFSKSLDYQYNQIGVPSDTNDATDPFSVRPDYGLSVNDTPQRFVGSMTIQPTWSLKNHWQSLAANGWTLAPIWTVVSGVPYSYGLSGGSSLAGGSTSANESGGLNVINFSAYASLAGNSGLPGIRRDSARQATIDDVDLRLSRGFTFREKYKLTLSGEAFNLLNRQNFTAYNTTAYTLSAASATATSGTATYQSSFGTPSAAGNTIYRERQIQFVGKFEF
jgi:hypothetical protein